jgi:hypothetical protein
MRPRPQETELAKIVVDKLHDWHWEVYQEVIYSQGRADIIAVNGNIRWGIECKTSLGLAVLEQAVNLKNYCHYVSVACPPGTRFAEMICRHFNIGILEVCHIQEDCKERFKPHLNRRTLNLSLHEEQKTYCEAGSNQGGHWTRFKGTKDHLIRYVAQHPGAQFSDVIKQIDHHYSSLSTAKSCLRGFIGTSVIPELRTEIVDRKLCVFLNDNLKEGV